MKIFRYFPLLSLFVLLCLPAQAQVLNRINRAAQNAAERAAEKAVTKKVEKEVTKAVDKGFEAAEKGVEAAGKGIEAANEKNEGKKISEPEPHTGPIIPASKDDTKFPFEHGSYVQVAYLLGVEVQQTVYFTRSGEWTAIEDKSEIKMFGTTVKQDKLLITKGEKHWDIDLAEKRGTYYEDGDHRIDQTNAALVAALEGKSQEGVEVIDLGQEVYLGYTCKKTQVKYPTLAMDIVCLSYGTLVLKSDGTIGPLKTSIRILSFDHSNPPAHKFEVPAGIQMN